MNDFAIFEVSFGIKLVRHGKDRLVVKGRPDLLK